jgi:RNA-binding protein Musashi
MAAGGNPAGQQAMMGQNMPQMMNPQGQGGYDDQSQVSNSNQEFNGQGQQSSFDREKYERREAQRMQQQQYQAQQANYGQAGPTSWEGMYDDIPQPNMGQSQRGGGFGRGGFGRGARQQNTPPVQQPSNAPANAPTGPKNSGRAGGGYRGGGRGGHRGYHPYSR